MGKISRREFFQFAAIAEMLAPHRPSDAAVEGFDIDPLSLVDPDRRAELLKI